MRNIFTGSTITEAAVVRNLLASNGIEAQLVEKGAGAYPSLPTEVWISQDDQQHHALELIRDQYLNAVDQGSWICAHCGEPSPMTFDLCWACGQASGTE
jgi:hypothetical protein